MADNEACRWLNEDEQTLWRSLRSFVWAFPSAMDRQLSRDSNLSTGEYSVLATLSESENDQLRPSDTASDLGWERSRLSHLLRRMEAKGLIERVPSLCDRRGHDVHLTQKGRATIEAAAPHHVEFVRESVFDALTQQEQDTLKTVLAKIQARLNSADLD
ncbi:MAG: MarR family winged helix-turn-helix transcriptional regulator [Galactobacter sp.]